MAYSFPARTPQTYRLPPDAAPAPQPSCTTTCFFSSGSRRPRCLSEIHSFISAFGTQKYILLLANMPAVAAKRFVIKQNKKLRVKEVVIKMPDAEIRILRSAVAQSQKNLCNLRSRESFLLFTEALKCPYCPIITAAVLFVWPPLRHCLDRLPLKMLLPPLQRRWARIHARMSTPVSA